MLALNVRVRCKENRYLTTWTWTLMVRTSSTIKPSCNFDSSINFFHPQSCSFFQNRCSVSEMLLSVNYSCRRQAKALGKPDSSSLNSPEYLDFLGSLLITAIVNCAKWFHPEQKQIILKIYRGVTNWSESNTMHQIMHLPGSSLSWLATQRKSERWLQTSHPCG